MLNFHFYELKFRLIYYLLSYIITFIIFFIYKNKIFSYLIPLNVTFSNILEIFWSTIYLISFITFILTIPYLFFTFLMFFKIGLFQKEYYKYKYVINLILIILLISFFFIIWYLMPIFLFWANTFNNEQISMQILFSSYINFLINLFYYFLFSTIFFLIIIKYKFNRFKLYFLLLFFITIISPPDFLLFLFISLFYFIFYEIILILLFVFKTRGL